MTWLRCSDRNRCVHCEIFRAGMENEQILDGLCQDNGIIQIENGRGQFSHNHVFCLTFSRSLCLPQTQPLIFFDPLCGMHANTRTPRSLYCSPLLLFSANSRCGNVERNLHRKQSPIRIALFMLRRSAAYKNWWNAWIGRRWAESGLIDNMHILMYTQAKDAHKYRYTRASTALISQSPSKCPQPPPPISAHLQSYWNTKPLYHLQRRRNKGAFPDLSILLGQECKLKSLSWRVPPVKQMLRAWGKMK